MAVKAGYKQTEIGVIPEDWHHQRLGNLGIFIKGSGVKKDEAQSGNIPCVRYGEIYTHHNDIIRNFNSYISKDVAISAIKIKKGDLLFAGSGETKSEIGKCVAFINDIEAYAGGDIVILRLNDANPAFMGYYCNSKYINNQKSKLGQGDAVVHISATALSNIDLIIPPFPEQQAIAEALSDVDQLIASLDHLIEKRRALKTATMQQLLTGKTRLAGFSGEWETKRLGDICKILSGGTPSTSQGSYWNGDIPWCTPTDITALSGKKYLTNTTRMITHEGLMNSSAEMIPEKSVIMTSRATIGECAINHIPVSTNQGFKCFVPTPTTDVEYLYYKLITERQGFISLCSGSTFLEISKQQIMPYEILLPPLPEQQAIAEVFSDMDAEITELEQRRDKTIAIKQGMMQELLTGRTRLI